MLRSQKLCCIHGRSLLGHKQGTQTAMPRVVSLSASLNTQTSTLRDLGTSFALRIIWHGLILARHSAALPLPIRDLTALTRSVWVLLPLPLLALVALFRLR